MFKFRLLPFLKADTILSGGKQVPTAEFADLMARNLFIAAGIILSMALVLFLARKART